MRLVGTEKTTKFDRTKLIIHFLVQQNGAQEWVNCCAFWAKSMKLGSNVL